MERWRTCCAFALVGLSGAALLWAVATRPQVAGGTGALPGASSTPAAPTWNVERIRAPEAWTRTTGIPDIVVAVIDSGIDFTIPELAAVRWTNSREIPGNGRDDEGNGYVDDAHGWDFRDGVPAHMRKTSLHWHGTFVAGIIAAQHGTAPVAGVAPRIRIMDVRFLDSKGLFYTRDWDRLAAAIHYAVDNGAHIINLSVYAKLQPPASVEQALARAAARGVIVVGIAGNDAKPEVSYPAKFPAVLAVAATDQGDDLARFSNWGPEVAVAAPGDCISSFLPGGGIAVQRGTSFAAPHVAGTLALILSVNPGISADKALTLLRQSCLDLGAQGPDEKFGAGLVDAGRAVAAVPRR